MEEQVTLAQMLWAREERAARQQALLEQYGMPLVSFVMNIAGPVKDSPLIRQGFALGEKLLFQQLLRENVPCVYQEKVNAPTGPEGLYVVKASAVQVKDLTEELEEGLPLGRLWDMDVISPQGIKLERAAPRRCLLCGQPAQVGARSSSHPLEELQNQTRQLLEETIFRWEQETAAFLTCRALLYEVSVTPKPGLVDRQNSGSHQDMDFYTFLDSAAAFRWDRGLEINLPRRHFPDFAFPVGWRKAGCWPPQGEQTPTKGLFSPWVLYAAGWDAWEWNAGPARNGCWRRRRPWLKELSTRSFPALRRTRPAPQVSGFTSNMESPECEAKQSRDFPLCWKLAFPFWKPAWSRAGLWMRPELGLCCPFWLISRIPT